MKKQKKIKTFAECKSSELRHAIEVNDLGIGYLMEKASKQHHWLSANPNFTGDLIDLLPARDISALFAAFECSLHLATELGSRPLNPK